MSDFHSVQDENYMSDDEYRQALRHFAGVDDDKIGEEAREEKAVPETELTD